MKNILIAVLGTIIVAGIISWGTWYDKQNNVGIADLPPGWNMLTNSSGEFAFGYAPDSTLQSDHEASIPSSFQPMSNFSEARFVVNESTSSDAVANCLTPEYEGQSVRTETVHDVNYTVLSGTDAGAGNYYETESYRTVRNGICVSIDLTIHSTNLMNYPTELNLHEFDHRVVRDRLHAMLATFRFLK